MPVTLAELGKPELDHAQHLLDAVLPGRRTVRGTLESDDEQLLVTCHPDGSSTEELPLSVKGHPEATLRASWRYSHDPDRRLIRADSSQFALRSPDVREPLVRLEFERTATSIPRSHWHFHGERGAFTKLLVRAGGRRAPRSPSRLASLHLPTGDGTFRPSLADFLEFLIVECGVDALPGWADAVAHERVRWRRAQMSAELRRVMADDDGRPKTRGLYVTDVRWVGATDLAMSRR